MSAKTGVQPALPQHVKVRLRLKEPGADTTLQTRQHIQAAGLHTVCQEASCPNLGHCWSQGTATFMILGDRCTRRCGFCDVTTGRPSPPDPGEPARLAEAVSRMKLSHVVITSVDRDDLADCGSTHFASVIRAVSQKNPDTRVEALIPDFKARLQNLKHIWDTRPTIINHNIETVPSLYRQICPQSCYQNSLEVLRLSAEQKLLTKSGIILGLGESTREVCQIIDDLVDSGVHLLTMGQYLQPSPQHAPLKEYIPLELFAELKDYALGQGMSYVEAGPLVRSSYHAGENFEAYLRKYL